MSRSWMLRSVTISMCVALWIRKNSALPWTLRPYAVQKRMSAPRKGPGRDLVAERSAADRRGDRRWGCCFACELGLQGGDSRSPVRAGVGRRDILHCLRQRAGIIEVERRAARVLGKHRQTGAGAQLG